MRTLYTLYQNIEFEQIPIFSVTDNQDESVNSGIGDDCYNNK